MTIAQHVITVAPLWSVGVVVFAVQARRAIMCILCNQCLRGAQRSVWRVAALVVVIGQLSSCLAATPTNANASSLGIIQFEEILPSDPPETSYGPVSCMEDRGTNLRAAPVFQNTQQPQTATPLQAAETVGQQDQLAPLTLPDAPIMKLRSFTPYVRLL